VAGVLVLLSIVLITIYFREPSGGGLHSVQSAGATVLRPFEVGAERIARPFQDAYGYLAGLIHAKSQNAELRRQIDQLSQRQIQNSTAIRDNAYLKRELRYVSSPEFPKDFKPVPTDVISRPPDEFQQQIVVEAGAAEGIRRDDPVVTPDGLVGKVTEVSHNTAQVTLLTDPSIRVSALDFQTGALGMTGHGQGQNTLSLDRVLKAQTLNVGDLVETQSFRYGNLTGIYPEGIVIGTITGASQRDVDLYWQAQIRPRVDFSSLRSVIVLVPKSRGGS
jgi:rod shape-determining protein MreC